MIEGSWEYRGMIEHNSPNYGNHAYWTFDTENGFYDCEIRQYVGQQQFYISENDLTGLDYAGPFLTLEAACAAVPMLFDLEVYS